MRNTTGQVVESRCTRFLWFGSLSWQNSWISTINRSLKGEIVWFQQSHEYRESDCIDGEFVVFEWKFFETQQCICFGENPNDDGGRIETEQLRSNHLHVHVQRHRLGNIEKTKKFVWRILQMLLHTPQVFPKDIGHSSDQELKKSGTERTFAAKTVCGIMLLRWWWSVSQRADNLYSEEQVRWPEDSWQAKEEEKRWDTTRWFSNSRVVVSHRYFS